MKGEKWFYWQLGYGVLSLSEKGIPYVGNYIRSQKTKYKRNDIVDVLEYISISLGVKHLGYYVKAPLRGLNQLALPFYGWADKQ